MSCGLTFLEAEDVCGDVYVGSLTNFSMWLTYFKGHSVVPYSDFFIPPLT